MSNIVRIYDSPTLVPTRLFPYGKYPFKDFNPIQSSVFKIYQKDINACIAASTSAGKTAIAEMFMAHAIHELGGKAMYVVPYKALAQEKIDDWTNPDQQFNDLNISICTGDYQLTDSRKEEMKKSDIIICTSEMLSSRTRNFTSEKNNFIQEISCLVIDESHLLKSAGRGDHLEVALMKMTEINPDVKIVMLSATMPNMEQICGWISEKLNGKTTYLLESSYRPVPLKIHYETYKEIYGAYSETEREKVESAMRIINRFPDDKFLVFTHTKGTGELALTALKEKGIECAFHNADLPKDKRLQVENQFKTDKNFRVVVATSTLSAGINMPARRAIIVGVHRGLTLLENDEIMQSSGRAGRPAYDDFGDTYILLPDKKTKFNSLKTYCETPQPIRSQLLTYVGNEGNKHYKVLAFHIISEIHRRQIKTRECFYKWFKRSLANYQAQDLDAEIIDNVISILINCGAIVEETGELSVTSIGVISSMMYYSPFDIADFKNNLNSLFQKGEEKDDLAVSVALANIDNFRFGICSNAERGEMGQFATKVTMAYGGSLSDSIVKVAFCYWNLLKGRTIPILRGQMTGLQYDFDRTTQVLSLIDSMSAKWNKQNWINNIKVRMKYGIENHLVGLCGLPEIGSARANRLFQAGIKTVAEVAQNSSKIASILNMSGPKVDAIIQAAKTMALEEML